MGAGARKCFAYYRSNMKLVGADQILPTFLPMINPQALLTQLS